MCSCIVLPQYFYKPNYRRLLSQLCQDRLALLIKEDRSIGFEGVCQSSRNLACLESIDDVNGEGYGKYRVNRYQERQGESRTFVIEDGGCKLVDLCHESILEALVIGRADECKPTTFFNKQISGKLLTSTRYGHRAHRESPLG